MADSGSSETRARMIAMDRLVLICLAVWAGLFGLATVTNFQMEFMRPMMGIAALVLGVVCIVKAVK